MNGSGNSLENKFEAMGIFKVSQNAFLSFSVSLPHLFFCLCVGNIPPGVNPEAYQWFQSVDTDRSGFINLKELKQALVNSNWSSFNDETCLMMISKSSSSS